MSICRPVASSICRLRWQFKWEVGGDTCSDPRPASFCLLPAAVANYVRNCRTCRLTICEIPFSLTHLSLSLCLFLVSCSAQQATQSTVAAPAVASTAAGVQRFRITPHDLQILEGTDTLLRCEVDARAGKVQWTKDGFALGFSAVIPGFPRYSVLVDAPHGTYNLQIKNATLEDDAEYQCQVGPAAGNPAIRANAKLSIVAAPSSIYIDGYSRNAKVEVIERQNLTLQCITENANPAAEIVWFQGETPVTLGKWR